MLYHAAYSLTYFFLHHNLRLLLFTGLILSPLKCSDTPVILLVAGVIKHILYRKGSGLLWYGFITDCFQSPTDHCVRAVQVSTCRSACQHLLSGLILLIFTDLGLRLRILHCSHVRDLQTCLKHKYTKN